MQLKTATKRLLPLGGVKNIVCSKQKLKSIVFLIIGIVVLLGIVLSSTYYGMVLYKTGEGDGFIEFVTNGLDARFGIIPNFFVGLFANPKRISIDIKQTDYQKLAYKRAQAMELGNLFAVEDDFVSAEIRYNGETIKTDIRLKGGDRDHWKNKTKWSFRLKIKNNETLFDMENFSLQHPRTRDYLSEWFFHKLLAYNDLFYLRYDFIDVTLNGKHLGIYAMEEHFEQRLIENNKYKEGVIVRFDPYISEGQNYSIDYSERYALTVVDAFQTNTVKQDAVLSQQFNQAKNLLESFKRGNLTVSQVFDIDRLAILFAIEDLSGYPHSTAYRNIRFYYNPITSLLEPIGFDNQVLRTTAFFQGRSRELQLSLLSQDAEFGFLNTFFQDKEFFKKYTQALQAISNKQFLDEFFASVEEEAKDKLAIIYKSFPGYEFQAKEMLYQGQKYLQNVLNPTLALQVYYKRFNNNVLELDLGNMQFLPLQVIGLSYKNKSLKPQRETILQSKKALTPIDFQTVSFLVPEFNKTDIEGLELQYNILGLDTIKIEPVFPWTYLDEDFLETDFMRQAPNWQQFSFLETDWLSKIIYIKSGTWQVSKNIIFPVDFTVMAYGGTTLNLTNSAKILSHSPIQFLGTEDNPIIIHSTDFTGHGIIVLRAEEKSSMLYVFCNGLAPPKQNDWQVSGAVTFYESPVDIRYSKFENNQSGNDYLNITRSNFNIENTLFNNTQENALTLDFSKGNIQSTSFNNTGNNAIGTTGSIVEMKDIFINKPKNKAIKAEKRSQITANNIELINTSNSYEVEQGSILTINGEPVSNK